MPFALGTSFVAASDMDFLVSDAVLGVSVSPLTLLEASLGVGSLGVCGKTTVSLGTETLEGVVG